MARPVLLALTLAALALAAGCGGGDGDSAGTTAATAAPSFDRAFVDAMIPHHEAAIEMAETAQAAGLSEPELVAVAEDVVETQAAEIEQLRAWRGEWFGADEPAPGSGEALGLSEAERGMTHDAAALEQAEDVDAEFARLMVDHHEGAIRMAKQALDRAGHDELRTLAAQIVAAQEREVEVLTPHAAGAHGGHG